MQIQYIEPAPGEYRPGACNIGPREIARRRAFALAGVVSSLVLGVILVSLDASPLVRAIVVFPLWAAIISFEQARRKFCAGFAFAGIRSVAGSDATEMIADSADLAVDRATARQMVAHSGVVAIALTWLFVLLPL